MLWKARVTACLECLPVQTEGSSSVCGWSSSHQSSRFSIASVRLRHITRKEGRPMRTQLFDERHLPARLSGDIKRLAASARRVFANQRDVLSPYCRLPPQLPHLVWERTKVHILVYIPCKIVCCGLDTLIFVLINYSN